QKRACRGISGNVTFANRASKPAVSASIDANRHSRANLRKVRCWGKAISLSVVCTEVLRVRQLLSQVTLAWWVYADRAAGGDRDHRHLNCPACASGAEGSRGGQPHVVHQQFETVRSGAAQLR